MVNLRQRLSSIIYPGGQTKIFSLIALLVIIITLPLAYVLVQQQTQQKSNAAIPSSRPCIGGRHMCPSGQYCNADNGKTGICLVQGGKGAYCIAGRDACKSGYYCKNNKCTANAITPTINPILNCRDHGGMWCPDTKTCVKLGQKCPKKAPTPTPTPTKKSLGQKCTVGAGECQAGLLCDPTAACSKTGICKGGKGASCNPNQKNCATGYTCTFDPNHDENVCLPNKNPTPTPVCKPTISPTPSGTQVKIQVSFNTQAVEVGANTGQGFKINNSPQHATRKIKLYIYDANFSSQKDLSGAKALLTATVKANFNKKTGLFDSTYKADASSLITASKNKLAYGKNYQVLEKMQNFLRIQVGFFNLSKTNPVNINKTLKISPIDINNDNSFDVLDYNQLVTCMLANSPFTPTPLFTITPSPSALSSTCTSSDINDNGIIDNDDMALFLQYITNIQGQ